MCHSGEYKEKILALMEKAKAPERAKSLQQRKDEGKEWQSVWRTVANCFKRTLSVAFFENDELTFDFAIE